MILNNIHLKLLLRSYSASIPRTDSYAWKLLIYTWSVEFLIMLPIN